MVAVGEDLRLVRQVRPAAVDEVDARQAVLLRDFLRAQVLLDRHRVIGAALHGGIVAHDHHLPARNAADPADQPRAVDFVLAVHAVGGKLADLEEGRAGIEQPLDPFAREQLAPPDMPLAAAFGPAERGCGDGRTQLLGERPVVREPRLGVGRFAVERRGQDRCGHPAAPISSRPISMRRISLVPAPISSSLASRM